MTLRSVVKGTGSALPARRVDNAEMAVMVETSDEWIVARTGIRQRYIAEPGLTTSMLGTRAAHAALADAGVDARSIDLLIVATSTADQIFPSTACLVQAELGTPGGAAFDLQAVCSGFVYALSVADTMMRGGAYRRALVNVP